MKQRMLLLYVVIQLLISCNNSSINDEIEINDTINLTNNGKFFACCKLETTTAVLKFPLEPTVTNLNSTGGGGTFDKRYKIGDKINVIFTYISSRPIYDADVLNYMQYCSSPKEDCSSSEVIETTLGKTSKIHCIDSNLVCNGFGRFDGKGYTFLKVEDYRPIPIPIKEAFAAELLSSFTKQDTVFHFDGLINGILDSNRYKDRGGKTYGRLLTSNSTNNDELFIVIDHEWYDGCAELHFLADYLIEKYFLTDKFKLITFAASSSSKGIYKRLATFIVYDNTDIITKDSEMYDGSTNFVDCIWIDESFANKLYSAEDCERWQMGR